MHRAFQLDEIVSVVAMRVAATKCADVVKLARACRTLAKPCLDILWSNYQHEFLPLIMCLPRDCFVLDDDGFESLYVSGCPDDYFLSGSLTPDASSTLNVLRNHANGLALTDMPELYVTSKSRGPGQLT